MPKAPRLVGVYVHLPFCDVKCAYCDFYSLGRRHVDAHFWPRYLARLKDDLLVQCELLHSDEHYSVLASIFFGGGTPSKAPSFIFKDLIEEIQRAFKVKLDDIEITAEANPESLTESVAADWKDAGINRVSVGLQSLDETALKYLGRLYNPVAYKSVLKILQKNGIANINADFITGIPGQLVASTLADLQFAIDEGVSHLSVYQLTLEPSTLLRERVERKLRACPDDAAQVEQMERSVEFLASSGFQRYEISNFSKPGYECRHNLIYWSGRPYLGLGVSAHMFTGSRRFFQPRSLDTYMTDQSSLTQDETATPRDTLINWVRLKRGFTSMKLRTILGDGFIPALKSAVEQKWIQPQGKRFLLTDEGLKFSDSLLAEFWKI